VIVLAVVLGLLAISFGVLFGSSNDSRSPGKVLVALLVGSALVWAIFMTITN